MTGLAVAPRRIGPARAVDPDRLQARLWSARFTQLQADLQQLSATIDAVLGARFKNGLGSLEEGLARLRTSAGDGVSPDARWADLHRLGVGSREVFGGHLELLGGAAIVGGLDGPRSQPLDAGLAGGVGRWLDGLLAALEPNDRRDLVVVAGRGPLVDRDLRLVRMPLLDWDRWWWPLLARAVALLQPPAQDDEPGLFADVFTTAVLGPAYAIAAMVLQLDYRAPAAGAPTAADRAAAMLGTLRAMNAQRAPRAPQRGPYAAVIERLEAVWAAMAGSSAADLAAASERLAPWLGARYDELAHGRLADALARTAARWAEARRWRETGRWSPPAGAADDAERITLALSGMWLHRLYEVGGSDRVEQAAEAVLAGRPALVGRPGPADPPLQVVLQTRLEQLARRRFCLQRMLNSAQVSARSRAAVVGRFLRLYSMLEYDLGVLRADLATVGTAPPPRVWEALQSSQTTAATLQQEALTFLGGELLRGRATSAQAQQPDTLPPTGLCDLADRLLDELVERTGVTWRARTVLGPDWFTDLRTDVVQVRFPDASVWLLPLVAHEFGHLVYRMTQDAQLRTYVADQQQRATNGLSGTPAAMLEEVYADVFATYALGPAFACAAIWLYFDPLEAHAPRTTHPTYAERAAVMLQVLRLRSKAIGGQPDGLTALRGLLGTLTQSWDAAVTAAAPPPPLAAAATDRVGAWVRALYPMIDRYYRVGAAYGALDWARARTLAEGLRKLGVSLETLAAPAGDHAAPAVADLLNGLWCARLASDEEPTIVANLDRTGRSLARQLLERSADGRG